MSPSMVNQAYIDGLRVDVMSPQEYYANPELYTPKSTCLTVEGLPYILPVRTSAIDYSVPGYYLIPGVYGPGASPFVPIVPPRPDQMEEYSVNNVVDYNNVSNIKELLDANAEMSAYERKAFLSDQPDDIVELYIDDMYDSPLMILCKRIINSKRVPSKLLENRMGNNYNNNMRLLKNKHDISYNKAVEVLNCIDVRLTATATNADPNVLYPMQSNISCDLN